MEDSITGTIAFAVAALASPFDPNPELLSNVRIMAIFLGIYCAALLCNVEHWITGFSNTDPSLDVVMNMKTRMNPVDILSLTVIVIGVAVRSIIILNLVYFCLLLTLESSMQVLIRVYIRYMKIQKKRHGRDGDRIDKDILRAYFGAGEWAQDQLEEHFSDTDQLVMVIYEKLGLDPVEIPKIMNAER